MSQSVTFRIIISAVFPRIPAHKIILGNGKYKFYVQIVYRVLKLRIDNLVFV